MTAKEYLWELKRMSTCIKQKEAEKRALYSASLSGAAPDRERVSGSTEDKMPGLVDQITELEAEIDEQLAGFMKRKHTIIDQIQALDNENYITVLHKRYVEFKALGRIADEVNYTYQHIRRLHGWALREFGQRYSAEIQAYEDNRKDATQ